MPETDNDKITRERLDRFIEHHQIYHEATDRLYRERWEAQQQAIEKAEGGQRQYNLSHNDLLKDNRQQADEFARRFETVLSRKEAESLFASVYKEIADQKREISILREAKSATEGRTVEKVENRSQTNWTAGIVIATSLSLLSLVITLVKLLSGG